MSKTVISVEHLSKRYELGIIGATSMQRDLNRWWARMRGRPDPYLKIGQEDLSDRFGEYIWALDNISFKVRQGEALGIIGRNGAGKSTLLKVLSQVTAPTKGKVKVKGRIGSLLEVGTGFHQELTGRENVFLNGAILGMTRAEVVRKLDEIIDFSGVEKYIDTPVKRYSSGMYVRLAFAVSAHLDPEILIVDEVLAVGDAEFRKKCLGKMGNITEEGRTVLFVSHNMASIQELTNRTILLDSGKIQKIGEAEEVISTYFKSLEQDTSKPEFSVEKELISIHSFKLIDERQTGKSWYETPLVFEAELDLKTNSDTCYFSLAIFNSRGSRLITTWDENIPIKKGISKIRYSLPGHNLPPGNYSANFSINGAQVGNNVFHRAIRFELDEIGYLHRRFLRQKDTMGTYVKLDLQVIKK